MSGLVWPLLGFVTASLFFVGKPFHLDDPMYLWAAKHILKHPLDFYGFTVNWNGTAQPMVETMMNPPLFSYYLAACGSLFGWSEVPIHLCMLLPAVAALVGTYVLAREIQAPPALAAVLTAFSPGFFVSSTTVMCDMLMVAAWIWAVALWIRGLRTGRQAWSALAALLVAMSALSKYFGVALLPLLAVYTIARERRLVPQLAWLVAPVAVLAGYEAWSIQLYGTGLLQGAANYPLALRAREGWPVWPKLLTLFAFTGGCFLNVALLASRPWAWKRMAAALGLAVAVFIVLLMEGTIGDFPLKSDGGFRWWIAAQVGALAILGLATVFLVVRAVLEERDATSLLLSLWVLGTCAFSAGINWSINARSLLPMGPALGLLFSRRLGRLPPDAGTARRWTRYWPVAAGAVVAFLVAAADYGLASASRDAAVELARELKPTANTVWFQGHWGFQYYAEENGLVPVDYERSVLRPGDLIVVPESNHNLTPLPAEAIEVTGTRAWPSFPGLATMNHFVGAGFYSDKWGPLPYVLGPVVAEYYAVVTVVGTMVP